VAQPVAQLGLTAPLSRPADHPSPPPLPLQLGETINGRAAMVGLVGLLVNEFVRGAPLF
jgi:hypothetical protein